MLGICNGFQVLTEARLLPGALRRNRGLRFECRDVYLRVERDDLPFTSGYRAGTGAAPADRPRRGQLRALPRGARPARGEPPGRLPLRLAGRRGRRRWNSNGSARAIAGVANERGNVLGLMPHPERCAEEVLGNMDGLGLFEGIVRPEPRSERRDDR